MGATSYGNTSDLAMIRECLIDAAEASKVLGVDKSFRKRIKKTLSRLYPYQVGKDGNLQEWYYDWQDQDPYHRHQSHLFGLYPGIICRLRKLPNWRQLVPVHSKLKEMKRPVGVPGGV